MALGLATSPTRARGATGTVTTASYTPAAGTVLLAHISADSDTGNVQTATLTTSGVTWTKIDEANETTLGTGHGGYSGLWWARGNGSAQTLQVVMAFAKPVSVKVNVWTGANTLSPIGAHGIVFSTTTPTNTGYTSKFPASRGQGVAMDWNNGSTGSSSDTNDIGQVTGTKDGYAVWKAADTTAAGTSVTLNFNSSSAASYNICVCELCAAVPVPGTPTRRRQVAPPRARRALRVYPVVAVSTPVVVQRPTARPRRPTVSRRGRLVTPTRAQQNPPYVQRQVMNVRRLPAVRRSKLVTPVVAQPAPPDVFRPLQVTARRLLRVIDRAAPTIPPAQPVVPIPMWVPRPVTYVRRLAATRRDRRITPIPAQQPFIVPAWVQQPARAIRRLLRVIDRTAPTIPPAAQPMVPTTWTSRPATTPRRLIRPARRTTVTPTPTQDTPTRVLPIRTVTRRGIAGRRRNSAAVIPPQQPFIVPAWVQQPARAIRRLLRVIDRTAPTVTPPQQTVITTGWAPQPTAIPRRLIASRRGRPVTPVPAQQNPRTAQRPVTYVRRLIRGNPRRSVAVIPAQHAVPVSRLRTAHRPPTVRRRPTPIVVPSNTVDTITDRLRRVARLIIPWKPRRRGANPYVPAQVIVPIGTLIPGPILIWREPHTIVWQEPATIVSHEPHTLIWQEPPTVTWREPRIENR